MCKHKFDCLSVLNYNHNTRRHSLHKKSPGEIKITQM
uniref:Uncharacterized protein n=1 Tax=Arundo donax TaxID=35708 RepID=A0A0A9B968_ARUDO